jgi:signal peptidase I
MADEMAIDETLSGQDLAHPDLPTAPSPLPLPPRQGRHRVGGDPPPLNLPGTNGGAVPPLPPRPATRSDWQLPTPVVPEFAGTRSQDRKRRGRRRAESRHRAPWWELPLLVAVAILIAVLVKSFVVQPFYIPSASMEKTLHGCSPCHGDRILVNKPIYDLRDPHPGDIVVFHAPPGWDDEPPSLPPSNPVLRVVRGFGQLIGFVPPDGMVLVKRAIAFGGETVKGDSSGHVFVSKTGPDGLFTQLKEPYVFTDGVDSHAAFGPVTVPKGRLWVMGDHRNDSADSRFHCGTGGSQGDDGPTCDPVASTVPDSDVIGKAVLIAWPPSRWRTLGTPSTFKSLAAGSPLPATAGVVAVLPLYWVRRRRRRTRQRRGSAA